ncbi:hypothetical protein H310_14144 [Aphanomyces invadans]|uniref:Uncharacterized protein n=1 Tax=Aphanomyces invadans TaxID=157072 RepID=A0A024TCL4_9STRA|nr:hypothetical protein H310_14144 [Aphanomyces invadans]ETV91326.1 hypothetical protein H310_14144 [Aphanomyces invadans]|eukprot:XP_008880163.1 hypothetical protein H310_14144 [Aphanomyces invadans]
MRRLFFLDRKFFPAQEKSPLALPTWVLALPEPMPKEDPDYNPAKVLEDHLFHDKKYLQSIVSAQREEDLRDCDQRRGPFDCTCRFPK